jgi:hypothetical protein
VKFIGQQSWLATSSRVGQFLLACKAADERAIFVCAAPDDAFRLRGIKS